MRRHTHNSSGSPWAPLASPIRGRRPGQEEDGSFQGRTHAGQVEGLQAELAPQPRGGGVRPRGKPALPSGGQPWAREPGPQTPPGGCPCISLHPAAPRSLWAPVTSTVEPGHLPSRDRPGSPGSGPRCPFSPDGADGSWHMSGTPLLQTRGSHQAYPLSSLWGGATISSILQMRKLRLRERCQGPAKPPPPAGTA